MGFAWFAPENSEVQTIPSGIGAPARVNFSVLIAVLIAASYCFRRAKHNKTHGMNNLSKLLMSWVFDKCGVLHSPRKEPIA
jgi:hypothetical protein